MPPPLHPDECINTKLGISPGLVENGEVLLRELYSPHLTNGKVTKRAVTLGQLKAGASVHRMEYSSSAFIDAAIRERLRKVRSGRPWTSAGVAVFTAEEVRKISQQNAQKADEQAFLVKDTALLENLAHASTHFADPSNKSDEDLRELRSDLLVLLQNKMPVDEAFQ